MSPAGSSPSSAASEPPVGSHIIERARDDSIHLWVRGDDGWRCGCLTGPRGWEWDLVLADIGENTYVIEEP